MGRKKGAPAPPSTSIFAEDQGALQQRAAQSNRNLFADGGDEGGNDFMLPSKRSDPKAKKKAAKKGGLGNLFGGPADEEPAAVQKPQSKAAVAKRLENLFDDDLEDDY